MIVKLESVIEKDPEYADALATLGMYEFLKFFYQSYWNDPEKLDEGLALIDQSTQHSELALKYAPMNKMAHLNLPFSHLISSVHSPSCSQELQYSTLGILSPFSF